MSIRILFCASLLILPVLSDATSIFRPVQPRCKLDQWFSESHQITSKTLPQQFLYNDKYVALRNLTNEPLYVLIRGQKTWKIADDQVYRWNRGNWDALTSTIIYSDIQGAKHRPNNELQLNATTLNDVGIVAELRMRVFRSHKSGSGRPATVPVPKPIHYKFPVQYKNQIHFVEGTYQFKLNENYNPTADCPWDIKWPSSSQSEL